MCIFLLLGACRQSGAASNHAKIGVVRVAYTYREIALVWHSHITSGAFWASRNFLGEIFESRARVSSGLKALSRSIWLVPGFALGGIRYIRGQGGEDILQSADRKRRVRKE
jgi:hypothetical protein